MCWYGLTTGEALRGVLKGRLAGQGNSANLQSRVAPVQISPNGGINHGAKGGAQI